MCSLQREDASQPHGLPQMINETTAPVAAPPMQPTLEKTLRMLLGKLTGKMIRQHKANDCGAITVSSFLSMGSCQRQQRTSGNGECVPLRYDFFFFFFFSCTSASRRSSFVKEPIDAVVCLPSSRPAGKEGSGIKSHCSGCRGGLHRGVSLAVHS